MMTDQQLDQVFARVKSLWPTTQAASSGGVRITWGEHLRKYAADDLLRAFTNIALEKPRFPALADVIARLEQDAQTEPEPAEPCTCLENFRSCKAKHPDGWLTRREAEDAANVAAEKAARMGVELDPYAYPGIAPEQLHAAYLRRHYEQQEADHRGKPPGKIEAAYLANLERGMRPADALDVAMADNVPKDSPLASMRPLVKPQR